MPVYRNKVECFDFLRGKNGNIIGVVFDLDLESAQRLREVIGKSLAEAKEYDRQDDKVKKIRIETHWANRTKDRNGYASFCQCVKFLKPKASSVCT